MPVSQSPTHVEHETPQDDVFLHRQFLQKKPMNCHRVCQMFLYLSKPANAMDEPRVAPAAPAALDPDCREPDWKRIAIQASTSSARISKPSLPWEDPSVSAIFRTGNFFQATVVSGLRYSLAPTQIGL